MDSFCSVARIIRYTHTPPAYLRNAIVLSLTKIDPSLDFGPYAYTWRFDAVTPSTSSTSTATATAPGTKKTLEDLVGRYGCSHGVLCCDILLMG